MSVAEESSVSGLDALEARQSNSSANRNRRKSYTGGPKRTGSQIFVRYEARGHPVYRIRAGSHEPYDKTQVKRVLTSQARGTAKVTGLRMGFREFLEMQKRRCERLDWRGGRMVSRHWKGEPFSRRITHGSALDGDRVIYQKAAELESAYRKTQGLEKREDVNEEDHIDDTESDASSELSEFAPQ
ncbi:hypothetical protein N7470_001903 [Penicillium chermesinum]|nr:hypothetical protein N7470_001903 [Penicillium chermesinum]